MFILARYRLAARCASRGFFNRLSPNRACTFPRTSALQRLIPLWLTGGLSSMDCLMTVTADNHGLPPSWGHNFDPSRFLPLSLFFHGGDIANFGGSGAVVTFGDRPLPSLR